MILNIVSLFALPRFCLFHEFPIKFYSHVDSVLWISHRQRHVQNYRRRGDECCRLNSHDGRDAATSTPGRTDKGWIPTPNRIRPTLFSKMRSEVRKLVNFNFLLLERILCESFYLKSFHLSFQDAKLSKCFYSSMKHLYCSNVCFENFLRSRQRRKCHRPFAPTARRSTDSCTGSETALNKSDISWFLQPSSAFAAPATDHWKLWFSAPFAAWVVAG